MQRARFTEEVRLVTEQRLKYQGTAKVSLDQIQFNPPLPQDLDSKNLERLRQIFRKDRCRRLVAENRIPAMISEGDLAEALEFAKITRQDLMTNDPKQFPLLQFQTGQLRGLHGRHRAQAGCEVLPPVDRWWAVDLYLDDVGEELKTTLVEQYANQKKPSDGKIYRKIRQYEEEQNDQFRQQWLARLIKPNQDRLQQLDSRRNRLLRRGFDALLVIPGLWGHGMRISMIHRVVAIDCIQEILTYLGHIRDFWSSLVNHSPAATKKIDEDTVEKLQLMAPRTSQADAKTVKGLVLSGQVFSGFDENERGVIWTRMEAFDGLIPSLYTFFEDFKYLESCAHCVKRLFVPSGQSIRETMEHMFTATPETEADCLIQTSESSFRQTRMMSKECLDLAYRQVWLYAMRHYLSMPADPKEVDNLLAKPNHVKADERVVYNMAQLAHKLGFRSPEIKELLKQSPDRQIARAALLQAREASHFQYDAQVFDTLIDRIVECFSAAIPIPGQSDPCELLADSSVKPRVRCGMPRMRTHKQDRHFLFLDHLHAATDTITTLFVRRCVYLAFFGQALSFQSGNDHRAHDLASEEMLPDVEMFVSEDEFEHEKQDRRGRDNEQQRGEHNRQQSQQQRSTERDQQPMDLDCGPQPPADTGLPGDEICQMNPQENIVPENTEPALERRRSGSGVSGDSIWESESVHSMYQSPAAPGKLSHLSKQADENPTASQQADTGEKLSEQERQFMRSYLEQLERARQEQERLDEAWNQERLEQERPEQELGVSQYSASHYSEPGTPDTPRPKAGPERPRRSSSYSEEQPVTHLDLSRVKMSSHVDPSGHHGGTSSTEQEVEISFRSWERGDWQEGHRLKVNCSDPSPVERAAKKYKWKNFSLYDQNLQSLSPAQCFRAATADGTNTIFVISEEEEKELIAKGEGEGRLVADKQLLALTQKPRIQPQPEHSAKRQRL